MMNNSFNNWIRNGFTYASRLLVGILLINFFQTVQAQIQDQEVIASANHKAYFASGCFWCVELIFENVRGVTEVYSGYAGGQTENPTYKKIGSGTTGHAETVKILYDSSEVSFATLVDIFFGSHDPTTLNRQGPDQGTQYRSIAFYSSEEEKAIIQSHISKLRDGKVYDDDIVTEVKSIGKFYLAEEYHQDFEKKNPNHPYVQNVSIPRFKLFQSKYAHLTKTNDSNKD